MGSRSLVFAITLLVSLFSAVTAGAVAYVVQPRQNLSKVLGTRIPGPVWGKNGSLRRVLTLNPGIRNPDRIHPGQKIELGDFGLPEQRAPASVEPSESVSAETPVQIRPKSEAPTTLTKDDQLKDKIDKDMSALVEEKKPAPFGRYSEIVASAETFYTRLDATDRAHGGTAILLSELNYGVRVDWRLIWSEGFRTYLGGGFRRYNIIPARGGQVIDGGKKMDSRLRLGLEAEVSRNLQFRAGLVMGQELYLVTQESTKAVSLDHPALLQAEASLQYWALPSDPLGLGIELSAKGVVPSNQSAYSTQLGRAYSGKVLFEQRLSRSRFGADVYFEKGSYPSTIVDQTRSDIGLGIYFTMNVGKP